MQAVSYIFPVEDSDKILFISLTLAVVRKPVECKTVLEEINSFSFNLDKIVSTGNDEILRF